jgi:hypothetical protein
MFLAAAESPLGNMGVVAPKIPVCPPLENDWCTLTPLVDAVLSNIVYKSEQGY